MPDHFSPRLVAQQVLAKLLRGFCAPLSESRNHTVPEYCWRSGHARACPSRARSRSLISERNLASRQIRFQEKRLFDQRCDRRGYGHN